MSQPTEEQKIPLTEVETRKTLKSVVHCFHSSTPSCSQTAQSAPWNKELFTYSTVLPAACSLCHIVDYTCGWLEYEIQYVMLQR